MEESKPVEEMTPFEMATELNMRREADSEVRMLLAQNQFMRDFLKSNGILVAFSEVESAEIQAFIKQKQEGENNGI